MERYEDWRARLSKYVREVRSNPYELGSQDCWLFIAGAINAMVGVDIGENYRGKYTTPQGAIKVMRKAKASNLASLAQKHLTLRDSVIYAQIGDVMGIPTDDEFGFALGILNGERILVVTPNGIDSRDRSEATIAFEV